LPTPPLIFVSANILTLRAYASQSGTGKALTVLCARSRRCALYAGTDAGCLREPRLAVAMAEAQQPRAHQHSEMANEQKSSTNERADNDFHDLNPFEPIGRAVYARVFVFK
jgi:hypothetical protein